MTAAVIKEAFHTSDFSRIAVPRVVVRCVSALLLISARRSCILRIF